jgi:hypothetical protein
MEAGTIPNSPLKRKPTGWGVKGADTLQKQGG